MKAKGGAGVTVLNPGNPVPECYASAGDILLQAKGASSDVTVSSGITGTGSAGRTLTVQADNSILFNSGAGVVTTFDHQR